jgi:hypothetical protein
MLVFVASQDDHEYLDILFGLLDRLLIPTRLKVQQRPDSRRSTSSSSPPFQSTGARANSDARAGSAIIPSRPANSARELFDGADPPFCGAGGRELGARGGGREGRAKGPDGAGTEVKQPGCCGGIMSNVIELRGGRLHTDSAEQEADGPRDERYGQSDELLDSNRVSSTLQRVVQTRLPTCLIHHSGPAPPGGPNAPVAGGIPT